MTVRHYLHTDTDAPVLTGTVGSLIALLDACLVNGYGSKVALGWSKPYSGTNLAVYRASAGTQAYLRVSDVNALYADLRGYMGKTDATDTGTDPFPTVAQLSSGLYGVKSSTANTTARPWTLVGDGKTFHLFSAAAVTDFASSLNSSALPSITFGDLTSDVDGDSFHAALIANTSSSSTASPLGVINASASALPGHYMPRPYTQTGTAFQFSKAAFGVGVAGGTAMGGSNPTVTYPDPVTGGMLLDRVYVIEPASKVRRGHLRGIWNILHQRAGTPGDTFQGKAGTSLAGKTFMIVAIFASSSSTSGNIAIEISDTWD